MQSILKYEITERLFESENARVYRTRHLENGQTFILKVLNKDFPTLTELSNFRAEYENTRSLDHLEQVIQVERLEAYQNTLVMVEKDVGGVDLAKWLKTEHPDLTRRLEIALQLAEILSQLHDQQVIHKDINPTNLIWQEEHEKLYFIDFGIATRLKLEHQEFQHQNDLQGTLAYIAPEQTGRLNRALDYRSDLYSCGATLYQLFTGSLPFEGLHGIELVHAHIALVPPSPHQLNPNLPECLSSIIMRLMEKMPDDRYQSAKGLAHDLQRCLRQLQEHGRIEPFELGLADYSAHFQIPQKLYGRDEEIQEILSAFERTSSGGKELTLVSGYSGTGKSSLVHEVHKPLTVKHGLFISGKFDQYERDIPYFAWISVISEWINLILKEDEDSLQTWKQSLLESLGNVAGVVVKLVPKLETLLGKQPEPPELNGEQALNRFNYALNIFFKTICRENHPLVVFIDDWQWADSASMNLLRYLLSDRESRYLLIIAAYRNNEVTSSHPFQLLLDDMQTAHVPLNWVEVGNLKENAVYELVGDALGHSRDIDPLVNLINEKTQGNAFFLIQFLNNLYKENLISFDAQELCWQTDLEQIKQLNITDNVVDLMAFKLRKLESDTLTCLTYAACIGNRFDLTTLSVILQSATTEVAGWLEPAIMEGILKPLDSNYRIARLDSQFNQVSYQFIHDRIQQAAYGLIETDRTTHIHEKIATTLLEALSKEEAEQRVFELVKHLNLAKDVFQEQASKDNLLHYNLLAGRRAKEATAYAPALHYFQLAIDALPGDYWQSRKEIVTELLLFAAEVAFLSKKYDLMEGWLDELQTNLTDLPSITQAYAIRLQAYTAQNRLAEAVAISLKALKELDCQFPDKPGEMDVLLNLLRTKMAVKRKPIAKLMELPAMKDPKVGLSMNILGLTIPPAYWASPNLVFLVIFQLTRNTIKYGYSKIAGFGLSWWGITECAVLGNIDLGYQYGKCGIDLARKQGLPIHQSLFYWGWIIKNYKHHIRESVPELYNAYKLCLELGDIEYASYSLNNKLQAEFHCGAPLRDLTQTMATAEKDLESFKVIPSINWHAIWWQTAENFQQETENPVSLQGVAYDEQKKLPEHTANTDVSALFLLYCAKLMLSVYFNDKDTALDCANKGRQYIKGGLGMFAVILFHYYEALALLTAAEQQTGWERRKTLRKVKADLAKLRKWASHAPENHLHRCHLIQAEQARLEGDFGKANEHYHAAIEHARDQGFVHECALAWEYAARFYIQRGLQELAVYHLRQARYYYNKWEATSKVVHLESAYSEFVPLLESTEHIVSSSATRQGNASTVTGGQSLDMVTILKASQIMSQEIVLDNLLKTLLKISIENAGAQKGILFFQKNSRIKALAGAKVIDNQLEHFDPTTLPSEEDYAHSVFNVTVRTEQQVLLDEASNDPKFENDPYIRRNQTKSVIGLPIHYQAKLIGVLYLENDLIAGAFNRRRVEILKLLSSHAAIALINANHYALLESEVQARTAEIEEKNLQLKAANEAKSDFLAKMSHEIRTPMNAVIGLSKLTLKTKLTAEQQDYLEKIVDSADVLLGIINDILDFSKIEAGKMTLESIQFNLEKLLDRVINVCALKAYAKGLELIVDISKDIPKMLVGDPLRLQQILVNLANNAIKFTETGHIAIMVQPKARSKGMMTLEFIVRDTGIGMKEEQCNRLFQSFSQADDSTTRKYGGTGLGLAISKQLTELMGGQIWVSSQPDVGSEFGFTIQAKVAARQPQLPSLLSLANLNILVVDDNEITRAVLTTMLSHLKANIMEAENGQEAVTLVKEQYDQGKPFDLVIMDWKMPQMDGIEASRIIKQNLDMANTPAILMASAYDKDEAQSLCAAVGIEGYMEKPFHQSSLINTITNCLIPTSGSQPLPPPEETAKSPLLDMSGGRVLLVEDNAINRQVAIGFLNETGISLDIAENGKVAVEKVHNNEYDLVLMDIQMPEMDGLTAAGEIRKLPDREKLPIIAMTAHAMPGEREKSLNSGMNDHITKPIDPDDLYHKMARWMDTDLIMQRKRPAVSRIATNDSNAQLLEALNANPQLMVDVAIQKIQGKTDLYLNLAVDFVKDYRDIRGKLTKLWQEQDLETLYRFAHSLRSNAAYIGALVISKAAQELELAVDKKQHISNKMEITIELVENLIKRMEVDLKIKQKVMTNTDFDFQAALGIVQRLIPLVEDSDAKAEDLMPALNEICSGSQHQEAAETIEELLDDIEYDQALVKLKLLEEEMQR